MWLGFLHFHFPSPATTLSGSHPRRKCGILDSRNMNVTVCHSCSHAPGAPGKPRQTPRVEAGHAPLAWPLPPLQTLSCKTHKWRSECSQKPSKSFRAHIWPQRLCPRQQPRKTCPHRACLDHWSTSSSSKDTTPEEATSETCCCLSQLPVGSGQSSWQSLQESGSSSAGERQDSESGEL